MLSSVQSSTRAIVGNLHSTEIEDLQNNINWDLYDHLVVSIMSHGVSDKFITSDCREYYIEEFTEELSGKRTP
jgi:hypothetical protein